MFAGLAVSMLVYGGIQKAGKRLSPRRQAAQANLVTGFLEYIQGMGVVKAFGLGEMSGKAVNQAIGEVRTQHHSGKCLFLADRRLSDDLQAGKIRNLSRCSLSAAGR